MAFRFLAVDDSELNLKVTETILERTGIKTDSATSAEGAYRLLSSNAYDMILMDYLMPGVNGIEASEHIRTMCEGDHDPSFYKKIPIILLTAEDDIDTLSSLPEGIINDILRKPFLTSDITALIDKWCGGDSPAYTVYGIEPQVLGEMLAADKAGYTEFLRIFADDVAGKHERIAAALDSSDYEAYTVEVHRIKGEARMIGATELAEMSYRLELAGKALTGVLESSVSDRDNTSLIKCETPSVLKYVDRMYEDIAAILRVSGASAQRESAPSDGSSSDDSSGACHTDIYGGGSLAGASSSGSALDMEKLRRYVRNASDALDEQNTELAREWLDEVISLIK